MRVENRIVRDEANSVNRDHNMKGLISLGKGVGLFNLKNKEKPLSSLAVTLPTGIDLDGWILIW